MPQKKHYIPELVIHDRNNLVLKYILVFFAISQCGIGVFQLKWSYPVIFGLLIFIIAYRDFGKMVNILPWIIPFLIVYIYQYNVYGGSYGEVGLTQYVFAVIRNLTPFMYLIIVGREFFKYYIRIIYYYSLVSFGFLVLSIVFPFFREFVRIGATMYSIATKYYVVEYKALSFFQLFTYTQKQSDSFFLRNAGPFWEPGAFAVYLGIALVMQYLYTHSLNNKYNVVFTIAMLTTQSTAGYATLMVFYMCALALSNHRLKVPYLMIIAAISFAVYSYAPFMKTKVEYMYQTQTEQDLQGITSGRFYAARKSINAISEYPIFGRGITRRTAEDAYSEFAGGYGFLNIPAKYGIPLALIYFYAFWKSLMIYASATHKGSNKKYVLLAILSLVPVFFSQTVYDSVVNLLIMQTSFLYHIKPSSPQVPEANVSGQAA